MKSISTSLDANFTEFLLVRVKFRKFRIVTQMGEENLRGIVVFRIVTNIATNIGVDHWMQKCRIDFDKIHNVSNFVRLHILQSACFRNLRHHQRQQDAKYEST